MSPATSTHVRRRAAARKNALARQQKLNEERRRRDEHEVELAADFAVSSEQADTARAALQAAELAMGRVVDTLIGDLRIRYPRAAELVDVPEDDLRRLRQLATDASHHDASSDVRSAPAAPTRRNRADRAERTTAQPATAPDTTPDAAVGADPGTDA